ncbi:MAG: RAMP superfamily CRISPR-associated protein [Tannerella sp.]|uniref:RAMP superfamily CRISPR-associated protein n=1 Tax=Tannerella sp. TaxID=2382127 RepID=UPI003FA285D7
MNTNIWLIQAKTNLHVGNENTSNYGLIDKAIQRDPLTQIPCINSSSLKGALNEFCTNGKNEQSMPDVDRLAVFGSDKNDKKGSKSTKGKAIFYDAKLLFLPMQTNDANLFKYVTSSKVIDLFNDRVKSLGSGFQLKKDETVLKNVCQLCRDVEINDEEFTMLCGDDNLPIIARNKLDDGTSANLWYEQVLPAETILYAVIQEPKKDTLKQYISDQLIQIGANATIGYGYCKFTNLNK